MTIPTHITDRRAGFILFEVLVALIVAALFLGVLAQALAGAWQNSRRPLEQVAALNLARALVSGSGPEKDAWTPEGRVDGFAYTTTIAPLVIELRDSRLAPAPPSNAATPPRSDDIAPPVLQRMTIAVRAPSGRRLILETIRLDTSARMAEAN